MNSRYIQHVALGALLVAASAVAGPAFAGTIFLSGDSNITNPAVGNGITIDTGNQTFFENVLQGGTSVKVLQGNSSSHLDLDNFYSALAGVSASVFSGAVTASALSGVDLFFVPLPDDALSAAEISVIGTHLNAGGSVFFLGDNLNSAPAENARINAALAALGSAMSIVDALLDTGYHVATPAQIAADPFNAGVLTFKYALTSEVTGGTGLFTTTGGTTFVAYQQASGEAVPEPAPFALVGFALAGIGAASRRRRR